jgi:hypothetical protein
MTARWVAGSVRARALARRRVGAVGAHALAAAGSLEEALEALAGTPYGQRLTGPAQVDLTAAQHSVRATLLWHLRVLAGWQPRDGAATVRTLAGWFEIANVEEHLAALAGRPAEPPYEQGALVWAWPRLAATTSAAEVRDVLRESAWGDPGGETAAEVSLGMRLTYLQRVHALAPEAASWAVGALALGAAREVARHGRLPEGPALGVVHRLLGPEALAASTLEELVATAVPVTSRYLDDVSTPEQLWQAEQAWWRAVETDGQALLRSPKPGPQHLLGAAAVLAVDAWRTCAALEVAGRGRTAVEVLDATA